MSSKQLLNALAGVVASAIFAAAPMAAQTGAGVVQGTLLDASKASIPGASATLTNSDTGVMRTVQSNSLGLYYFGAVPPGPYVLSVESPGFKKWEGKLSVEVGQTVTIDPSMEVGAVGATVEVTGASPVIATEGMQVSNVK